ncbi:MAG: hypothetical protein OEZ58_21680 [Gammaproteobacteria bacterium]|nr:hypothetical protein [Gammaproteobacteria bacterium]MDH5731602.1 hypothetical protein [Gammaproteobacteria bacterium]
MNKDLQKILLAGFGKRLAKYSFKARPRSQSFIRPTQSGYNSVHLSFINHKDDFDLTLDIAIRFDEVEDMVNEFNQHLTKKEKARTCTIGIELGNLTKGTQRRWTISSESDIQPVIDELMDEFTLHCEPYFEKYSTLTSVYEVLSSDERDSSINSPIHASRAKRSLAAANLLGSGNLEKERDRRIQFLEQMKDFGLKSYIEFTKSIINSD